MAANRDERYLTTEEVARRLEVKPATVYAYVSRGLLTKLPGTGRRGSRFAESEVDRLLRRGRDDRRPVNPMEHVGTRLALLRGDELYYRGHRVTDLATRWPLESVAHLLWDGELAVQPPFRAPAGTLGPVRAALAALPDTARLTDRLRVAVAVAGAADPLRFDLSPHAVIRAGRHLLALLVNAATPDPPSLRNAVDTPGRRNTPDGPGARTLRDWTAPQHAQAEADSPKTRDTQGGQDSPEARDTQGGADAPGVRDTQGGEDSRDLRGAEDSPGARDTRDGEDSLEARDTQGRVDTPELRDTPSGEDSRDLRGGEDSPGERDTRDVQGRVDSPGVRDTWGRVDTPDGAGGGGGGDAPDMRGAVDMPGLRNTPSGAGVRALRDWAGAGDPRGEGDSPEARDTRGDADSPDVREAQDVRGLRNTPSGAGVRGGVGGPEMGGADGRGGAVGRGGGGGLAEGLWGALGGTGDGRFGGGRVGVGVLGAALVLLADHDLAVSTVAARVAASARAHPYAVVSAGLGALDGHYHGSASTLAHRFLGEALDDPVGALAERLRIGQGLPGFGHAVYTARDPRAELLLELLRADERGAEVVAVIDTITAHLRTSTGGSDSGEDGGKDNGGGDDSAGGNSGGAVFPNVDLALAALVHAFGLAADAGEAIFAVARTAGWLAHALEEYAEPGLRFRPRGVYLGPPPRTR